MIFSGNTRCKFQINLTQAIEFICRFYHIFQGYSYKNLHFPHIKHCPNSFAIKRRRKSVCAIHFLLATCDVCPMTIPEFFAQTRVSDYWQIIHWIAVGRERSNAEALSVVPFFRLSPRQQLSCGQLSRGLFFSLRSRRTIRKQRDCS